VVLSDQDCIGQSLVKSTAVRKRLSEAKPSLGTDNLPK
jgi:hypothetical protein